MINTIEPAAKILDDARQLAKAQLMRAAKICASNE